MTDTALAIYRSNEEIAQASTFEVMPAAFELAAKLAATEFVPVPLRNKPAAVAACILQGHEVGLPPMASLQHIHVIEGRPSLSAAAQRALVLARGHEIWIEEQNATRATVCGRRKGEDRVLSVTWTLDDAKRAGLLGKQNWQRYPRNMLVARATGDVSRGTFMDVLGGIPYNQEELEDLAGRQPIDGDLVPASPPPAPAPAKKRRATRAATAPADTTPADPPPAPDPEPGGGDAVDGQVAEPPPAPEPDDGGESSRQSSVRDTPPPEPKAGEAAPGEEMTLAQQVAMLCRELGIERADLLFAVTGKTSGREITRSQAVEVLEAARAIQRGEMRLVEQEGSWQLFQDPSEEAWSE